MQKSLLKLLAFLICFVATPISLWGQPTSLDRWMESEQLRVDRTVDSRKIRPPTIKGQRSRFRPEAQAWFALKSVWVPASELDVVEIERLIPEQLIDEFVRTIKGARHYRLFIHPESEVFYKPILKKYDVMVEHSATSTASSRTVLVRSNSDAKKMYFVKLSLDVELGGSVRTIPRGEIARSIGTTLYLDSMQNKLSKIFKFIPETMGIIPKGWTRGGQIIRLIPNEVITGKSELIPLFSLYAKHPEGSTLKRLVLRSNDTPTQYVTERLLRPFFQAWVNWAVYGSIVMEAHAQNVLLEVDGNENPTGRIFHRDMGGFSINSKSATFDPELKKRLPVLSTFEKDYHQEFSTNAEQDSVTTYLEGGFLYNLNRELKKIDPGYMDGSIYVIAHRELLKAARALPMQWWTKTAARYASEYDLPNLLKMARKRAAANNSTNASCDFAAAESLLSKTEHFANGSKK